MCKIKCKTKNDDRAFVFDTIIKNRKFSKIVRMSGHTSHRASGSIVLICTLLKVGIPEARTDHASTAVPLEGAANKGRRSVVTSKQTGDALEVDDVPGLASVIVEESTGLKAGFG